MPEPKTQDVAEQLKDLKAAGDNVLATYDAFAKAGFANAEKKKAFHDAEVNFMSSTTSLFIATNDTQTKLQILQLAENTQTKLVNKVGIILSESQIQDKGLLSPLNKLTGSIKNLALLAEDGANTTQDIFTKVAPLYNSLPGLNDSQKLGKLPTEISTINKDSPQKAK